MGNPNDPGRVRALKALAHPVRLAMVEELGSGERCVCELRELVGLDLSTVSRHLKLLADAGLLDSRREGRKVFYSLAAPCVIDYLRCMDAVLSGRGCRLVVRRAGARR
jgi:ArsR family transcriptional regulator